MMRSLKLSDSSQKGFAVVYQAGVIPYRIRTGQIEVLLVTTTIKREPNRWCIPKGWIEPTLSTVDSATKEAYKEAGVLGFVQMPAIGIYERQKLGLPCQVEVFLLQVEVVLEYWQEVKLRKRRWFSVAQAIAQVRNPQLKQLLAELPTMQLSLNGEA